MQSQITDVGIAFVQLPRRLWEQPCIGGRRSSFRLLIPPYVWVGGETRVHLTHTQAILHTGNYIYTHTGSIALWTSLGVLHCKMQWASFQPYVNYSLKSCSLYLQGTGCKTPDFCHICEMCFWMYLVHIPQACPFLNNRYLIC